MNKHTPIHYFSNVPNNEEGAEFIRLARKFLNRKRYKLRVLGRGTRKVNGAKNSYRYSASLPHKFSERFSLYIDNFLDVLRFLINFQRGSVYILITFLMLKFLPMQDTKHGKIAKK